MAPNCAFKCGADWNNEGCCIALDGPGVLVRGTGLSTLNAGGASPRSYADRAGVPVPVATLDDVAASSPTRLRLPGVEIPDEPAADGVVESNVLRLLYRLLICACTLCRLAMAWDEYPAPRYSGLACRLLRAERGLAEAAAALAVPFASDARDDMDCEPANPPVAREAKLDSPPEVVLDLARPL